MRVVIPFLALCLLACSVPEPGLGSAALAMTAPCDDSQDNATDSDTGHCYLLFEERVTWDDAKQRCEELAGVTDLADITRQSEHRVVADLRRMRIPEAWLAGSDRDTEGSWVWATTGEPVVLDFWDSGEPDGSNPDEDCMTIQIQEHWHDRRCGDTFGYICEREPEAAGSDAGAAIVPDPESDEPGSLYACAAAPVGGTGSGGALPWLVATVAVALGRRRPRRRYRRYRRYRAG